MLAISLLRILDCHCKRKERVVTLQVNVILFRPFMEPLMSQKMYSTVLCCLFIMALCADLNACCKSKCRSDYISNCGNSSIRMTAGTLAPCQPGYEYAKCVDHTWKPGTAADHHGCIDPSQFGTYCPGWLVPPYRTTRSILGKRTYSQNCCNSEYVPMVCDCTCGVYRRAQNGEKPMYYLPASYLGQRCR